MYYEEKMIDGVMHYRGNPEHEFKPHDLKSLSARYEHLRNTNHELQVRLAKEGEFRDHINMVSSNFHMISKFKLKEPE